MSCYEECLVCPRPLSPSERIVLLGGHMEGTKFIAETQVGFLHVGCDAKLGTIEQIEQVLQESEIKGSNLFDRVEFVCHERLKIEEEIEELLKGESTVGESLVDQVQRVGERLQELREAMEKYPGRREPDDTPLDTLGQLQTEHREMVKELTDLRAANQALQAQLAEKQETSDNGQPLPVKLLL